MRRIRAATLAAVFLPNAGVACLECRPSVDAGIYNAQFVENAAKMVLPAGLLIAIGLAFGLSDKVSFWRNQHGSTD
jgi:hypothetical protein